MTPTWDILVCSILHRTDMLEALLDELERQLVPGVGVLVYRDNLECGYGEKCQALLESSEADYVSFLDDDDWIEPDFIPTIAAALEEDPDYVGFRVRYTKDGHPQLPVIHSLQHHGWTDGPDALLRDINHFNPIRRDLALRAVWAGGDGADRRWANSLREQGCVQREVFIDREMHHYRNRSHDTFVFSSVQQPLDTEPERPAHGFVTWVT
jgi:glycosyltransferase involved in cell wall biosynthesis